jgi:predicted Zn-dependent protease
MDEPQNVSRSFSRDLTLDWRNTEWDYLEKYCSDLYNSGKGPGSMKAVRAICLMESNRDMEAAKFIDEAVALGPKLLPSLQAQAEYLWKLGRISDAQLLFQTGDFKQTRLALYVQGEACLKSKDYHCAEAAYKTLAERDYGDVIAHYGLAQVSFAQNDKARGQAEIKAGFEAETRYEPLIELRDKLESSP